MRWQGKKSAREWLKCFISCLWNLCLLCDGKVFTPFIAGFKYLRLCLFWVSISVEADCWAIVLYINDKTPSMKAPHMAGLYVVFASDNTVQSSFIFLKLLWSFFTLLICIDPCKSQGYEKYGGGQRGGFSLCNSVQNIYHIGFTRRKAYKATGLKEQQNNGMSMLWLFLCFQSFSLSHRSHGNTVSEAERGTIR